MASTLANFFSFLLPSKPQPAPSAPPLLNLSTSPQSRTKSRQNSSHNFAPLISQQQQQQILSDELSSVICPSLAYANTLFYRSGYNVQVVVDDNEHEERLIGRFRREVMKAGVIQECKRRKFFENSQDEKKRRTREAAKRNRRRRFPPPRAALQNKQETSATKKPEADDNWDLPEEGTLN